MLCDVWQALIHTTCWCQWIARSMMSTQKCAHLWLSLPLSWIPSARLGRAAGSLESMLACRYSKNFMIRNMQLSSVTLAHLLNHYLKINGRLAPVSVAWPKLLSLADWGHQKPSMSSLFLRQALKVALDFFPILINSKLHRHWHVNILVHLKRVLAGASRWTDWNSSILSFGLCCFEVCLLCCKRTTCLFNLFRLLHQDALASGEQKYRLCVANRPLRFYVDRPSVQGPSFSTLQRWLLNLLNKIILQ